MRATNRQILTRLKRLGVPKSEAARAPFCELVRKLKPEAHTLPELLALLDDQGAPEALWEVVRRLEAHAMRAYLGALAAGTSEMLPHARGWARTLHMRVLRGEKELREYKRLAARLTPAKRTTLQRFLDEMARDMPEFIGRVEWLFSDSKDIPEIADWRIDDQSSMIVELTPVRLGRAPAGWTPPLDPGELAALLRAFDDGAAARAAQWATLRRVEAAPAPTYLRALFDAASDMAVRAPAWAALLHARALADPAQQRRYRELFRQLAASRRRIVRPLLERAAAQAPSLAPEIQTVLGGMR
jgi:hypothetical protein